MRGDAGRLLFLFVLSLALPTAARAAEASRAPDPLTLAEAFRLAAAYDARIAAARAALEAGREQRAQGRALLLPALGFRADTTYNDLDVAFHQPHPFLPSGTRRYNSNRYGVVLNQPLYDRANLARYRQSRALATQAEIGYAVALQELILRVTQAYFDALLAEDTLRYLEAQLAAVTELRDRVRRTFEAGIAPVADVREAEARFDLVRAQAIGARNEVRVRREALRKLLGQSAGALAPLRTPFVLVPPRPEDPEHWADAAEQSGFSAALARETVEVARQELARRQGAREPTLDLVANYADASENDSLFGVGFDTTARSVGVQVQMPLYAGGALSSQVREAAARYEQARHELDETARQARLDAQEAYLGLETGLAQAQAYEQAVLSSETALGATERGLSAGTRTALDVLNAQQQLYGARRELAASRYAAILAGLRLMALVGGLTETELLAVDALLEAP